MTHAHSLVRAAIALVFGSSAWGCATSEIDVAHSPADLEAESARATTRLGVLDTDFDTSKLAEASPAGAHAGHEGHAMPGDAPATYTCPHHPGVTSATPGACPNCGMDLVKKPTAAPNPHEGH